MDIRTISPEQLIPGPQNTEGFDYFEKIMALQRGLVDRYTSVEKLPLYPVDPNTKASQILLKDFIARITEELGEGYESMLKGMDLFHNEPKIDGEMIYYFSNFYEEIADALHFFMEALLYAGITQEKLRALTIEMVAVDHPGVEDKDHLDLIYLIHEQSTYMLSSRYSIFISDGNAYLNSFQDMDQPLSLKTLEYLFSANMVRVHFPKVAWNVTYHLQMVRNTLKNKPWKQSEMVTDSNNMADEFSQAFIAFINLTKLIGLTPMNLYYLYLRKNLINNFRISSGY